MRQQGYDRLSSYFKAPHWSIIIVGIACTFYFFLYLLPDSTLTRIFPALPQWYYIVLGSLVGFYQGFTWKRFEFFQGDWYKHFQTYLLFLSEFMILMFALCLLSWPFYFVYLFFQYLFRLN